MSHEKLKESLQEKGEARAREIWQEAEERALRHRREAEEHSAEERPLADSRRGSEVSQQLDRLVSRTEKRLRQIRLSAEEQFSEKLRRLALQRLATLSPEERRRSLQRLSAELPKLDWEQITVQTEDRQQATLLFPDCTLNVDPALTGGVIAVTAENTISVDNSLDKRLEQAWPKICGSLLDSIRSDDAETTA